MQVIYTLTESHIQQLHELYLQQWWANARTLDETRQCVAGSQVSIGLLGNNERLVGFTRVLTDFIFKALIFDVIVAPAERGTRLGDLLMQLVRTHEKLKSVHHFELYCLPTMYDFYRRHGFSTSVGDVHLMRRINDSSSQQ